VVSLVEAATESEARLRRDHETGPANLRFVQGCRLLSSTPILDSPLLVPLDTEVRDRVEFVCAVSEGASAEAFGSAG
jgi:hypothetical protein